MSCHFQDWPSGTPTGFINYFFCRELKRGHRWSGVVRNPKMEGAESRGTVQGREMAPPQHAGPL